MACHHPEREQIQSINAAAAVHMTSCQASSPAKFAHVSISTHLFNNFSSHLACCPKHQHCIFSRNWHWLWLCCSSWLSTVLALLLRSTIDWYKRHESKQSDCIDPSSRECSMGECEWWFTKQGMCTAECAVSCLPYDKSNFAFEIYFCNAPPKSRCCGPVRVLVNARMVSSVSAHRKLTECCATGC